MKTKGTFSVLLFISYLLYSSCAKDWNFYFPYYLLLGGIEHSIDQPFVSIMDTCYCFLNCYTKGIITSICLCSIQIFIYFLTEKHSQ